MNGRRYRDFDEWTLRRALRDNRYSFDRVAELLRVTTDAVKQLTRRWGIMLPLSTKSVTRSEFRELFNVQHPADALILENHFADFIVKKIKNHTLAERIKKEWGIHPEIGTLVLEYNGTTDSFTFYQYTQDATKRSEKGAKLSM